MSGKSRMHPRNIYQTHPDFNELAISYPEFRKYVKQELSGRAIIDYSDPYALKELSRTLLKKDFDLDVDIDVSRLIPRIPICLNYILWVEDLLMSFDDKPSDILGIDIGTGGVCIYSLLAAKKGWKMLATEIDEINFKNAENNVQKNKLENVIALKLVSNPDKILDGVIDEDTQYDFCMCNPPFFDYDEKPQNRTSRRKQLKTKASDTPTEIVTEGGEISFVKKLFEESMRLGGQVKIYTTLVGKKSDFQVLKKELKKKCFRSFAVTEFCQGRTMRWGLAWSFLNVNLRINSGPSKIKYKKPKTKIPVQIVLSKLEKENLNDVIHTTKTLFAALRVNYREEIIPPTVVIYFKAYKNTWSHQRQKRRSLVRAQINSAKNNSETNETGQDNTESVNEECSKPKIRKLETEETCTSSEPIVEGSIIHKTEKSSIMLEIFWISGCKQSFHQVCQYFKNYWKRSLANDKNLLTNEDF